MKKLRALVLGSNSFSGINMVRHLLVNNFSVVGVSRSDFPHEAFAPVELRKRFRIFKIRSKFRIGRNLQPH